MGNIFATMFRGENSFQQNPLHNSNIVSVNADFKENTLEVKSRKTLKSADPLKVLTTACYCKSSQL